MRKIHLHSYLREDGIRVPYRVSSSGESFAPYHPDDRIEDGFFVTRDELEIIRKDAFQAARQTSLFWYVHDTFDSWVSQRRTKKCALETVATEGEK